jgi:formylglycine-generating enzyme required for sulfatase activity
MALGSADGLDMALLKVAKLDKPCLNQFAQGVPDTDIFISGYSAFKDDNTKQDRQQKRLLKGKLGNAIKLTGRNSTEEFAAFDIINIKNDVFSKLADGYSGSPLCNQEGKVIGVVSHRVGGEQGHALCISNLKRLYPDINRLLKGNMTASPPKDWQSSRYTKIITAIVIVSIIAIVTLTHNWQPEPKTKLPEQQLEEAPAAETEKSTVQKTNVIEPEMVAIKGGCFMMGSPDTEKDWRDDEKQHQVCVDDFAIGKYEVTQKQWQAVMGNNPSKFKGDNLPVEQVSSYDAQDFINKLNAQTGQHYRLPTEAEWEYAARAGTTTPFYTGNCINTEQANYNGTVDYNDCGAKTGTYKQTTVAVGSYPPNRWGLYDMAGNVWEWTCSGYDENYGGNEKQCVTDNSTSRVLRGGSWFDFARHARSASSYNRTSDNPFHDIGFRLALGQTVK